MDARALLRAKKAGATASASSTGNPYLKVDAKGDQRCSICGVLGEYHKRRVFESKLTPPPAKHWDAHQVSKQHKTSLQRIRQEEAAAAAATKKKEGKKRQAVDDVPMTGPTVEDVSPAAETENGDRGKRVRTDDVAGPVDTPPANATVDAELDLFLSSLSAIPDIPAEPTPSAPANKSRYKTSQPETQTHYESAPVINAPPATKSTAISSGATAASNPFAGKLVKKIDIGPALPADDGAEEEEEETEAERRAREQREEREEIMDRLEEEQRAQ